MRTLFLAPIALAACFGQTGPAKMQEAAIELNVNARFGRMELASERVAPKGRQDFFGHRQGWGGRVRVADTEVSGLKMTGDEDAEVTVRVAWFRPDEGELHVTVLRQAWHDFKGDWKVVSEQRTDGDIGLLGERVVAAPDAPRERTNAQFPTVRIGGKGAPQEVE
jgi:hypothetical protein